MSSESAPIVETTAGRVRGAVIEGVAAFKTMPYGASTAGPNRFMPPMKPQPWAGIRDALVYNSRAPQAGLRPAPRPELAKRFWIGPPAGSWPTEYRPA